MKAQQESKSPWRGAKVAEHGRPIAEADVALAVQISEGDGAILPLREVRQRAEAAAVRQALTLAEGNVSRAAALLGVTRPTLYDLMERIAQRSPGK